jgi:hypothetical protein
LAEIAVLTAGFTTADRERIVRLLELAARLGWTYEELAAGLRRSM